MTEPHVRERVFSNPEMREGEWCSPWGRNDQLIIFSRDGNRPSAGMIRFITGRSQREPSLASDGSTIIISREMNVDGTLGMSASSGDGRSLPGQTGPSIAMKSDHLRLAFRKGIRIVSDDGRNFIRMDGDECEIKLGASWLLVRDGKITVQSGRIDIGKDADQRAVLGDLFSLLYNNHRHMSPTGPTTEPFVQDRMVDIHLSPRVFIGE